MMSAAAYEVRQLPGRGYGLVSAWDLQPGEEVLADVPLLLTPTPEARAAVCTACLRILGSSHERCSGCGQAAFCSPKCAAAGRSEPEIHAQWACSMHARADTSQLSSEQQAALGFLIQVGALRQAAAHHAGAQAKLQTLSALTANMSADVASPPATTAAHAALAAAAGATPPLSLEEAGRLLALEQRTAYGIMAPGGDEDERRVRGGGIYPTAALLNHECLPNVARFDDFDGATAAPDNTVERFRTLHAIPKGEELTQSYFPITWSLEERQEACREQYGFECSCPRCQVEAAWEEDAMSDGDEGAAPAIFSSAQQPAADGGSGQPQAAGGTAGGCTDEYVQLFIMKYVCAREECHGTLAPIHGTARSQCNMCGGVRTEAEFLAEMQSYD